MPVPQVVFNENTSPENRILALRKLEEWADSPEVSPVKAAVLKAIIAFAKKNLIPAGLFDYAKRNLGLKTNTHPEHMSMCHAIFKNADLPDLLFMQYVIDQININPEGNHDDLNNSIKPLALKYKKSLMIRLVHQLRQASMGIVLTGFIVRQNVLMILGAVGFLLSGEIAEWRLAKSLENELALKATDGATAQVGDGFDEGLDVLATVANRGLGYARRLFQLIPLPADNQQEITENDKNIAPKII